MGFSSSSCDAKPPPSHLCNYEVSGREARKSELVQIGRTVPRNLVVLQTLSRFALGKPLLSKTFSSVEYIRRIVCSWAIYIAKTTLEKVGSSFQPGDCNPASLLSWRPLPQTLHWIYRGGQQHERLFVPPPINCNSLPYCVSCALFSLLPILLKISRCIYKNLLCSTLLMSDLERKRDCWFFLGQKLYISRCNLQRQILLVQHMVI